MEVISSENPSTPPLDPMITRLLVVDMQYVIVSNEGWPMTLLNDSKLVFQLAALRPDHADPRNPAIVVRSAVAEPIMRLGTIDELVEAYRQYLMATLAHANKSTQDKAALALTDVAFASTPSGEIQPIFKRGIGDFGTT